MKVERLRVKYKGLSRRRLAAAGPRDDNRSPKISRHPEPNGLAFGPWGADPSMYIRILMVILHNPSTSSSANDNRLNRMNGIMACCFCPGTFRAPSHESGAQSPPGSGLRAP